MYVDKVKYIAILIVECCLSYRDGIFMMHRKEIRKLSHLEGRATQVMRFWDESASKMEQFRFLNFK
jgi:hypothetical protein